MLKKIIPVIALIGASALTVGISNKQNNSKENYMNYINSFHEDVTTYASLNTSKITKTALQKYALSVQEENFPNVLNSLEETTSEKIENNAAEPEYILTKRGVGYYFKK